MTLGTLVRKLTVASVVLLGALSALPRASAWGGWFGCCCEKCPPPYVRCEEGPPRLRFKIGCGKPVCDPCRLEHWGYYQNCWHPYPWPPDWSHCRVPPPGALVPPCGPGGTPLNAPGLETMPPARTAAR
jgi:hypothetical protein